MEDWMVREGEHVHDAHEIATLVVPRNVVLAVPRRGRQGRGGKVAVMFRDLCTEPAPFVVGGESGLVRGAGNHVGRAACDEGSPSTHHEATLIGEE